VSTLLRREADLQLWRCSQKLPNFLINSLVIQPIPLNTSCLQIRFNGVSKSGDSRRCVFSMNPLLYSHSQRPSCVALKATAEKGLKAAHRSPQPARWSGLAAAKAIESLATGRTWQVALYYGYHSVRFLQDYSLWFCITFQRRTGQSLAGLSVRSLSVAMAVSDWDFGPRPLRAGHNPGWGQNLPGQC